MNTEYYVVVDDGFLTDTTGIPADGIGGKDSWHFKTKADDSQVSIFGFKAEHIIRTADGQESREQIAAVVDGENARSYNILTPADYHGPDGKAYVNLLVTPLYNASPEDIKIKATNKEGADITGYVTQNDDATFTILMPSSEERANVTISIGNAEDNQFHVVVLNKNYNAMVNTKDVNAEVGAGELINSVDLSKEFNNNHVTNVNVILNIEKKAPEALSAEDIKVIEESLKALEENLKGKNAGVLYLDINMLKQVTVTTTEGDSTTEQAITNLQNPITITLVIPEEIRGDYTYSVIRCHGEQTDVIAPTLSEDGTKLSFTTDRFSTYAIAATAMDQPVNPDQPVDPDKPVDPDQPVNPDKPVVPEQPVNPDQPTTPPTTDETTKEDGTLKREYELFDLGKVTGSGRLVGGQGTNGQGQGGQSTGSNTP
ncbi:MAG: hypothetical protein RR614_10870, partial [Eubacterium sp.]